jgi:hypothetical protein
MQAAEAAALYRVRLWVDQVLVEMVELELDNQRRA